MGFVLFFCFGVFCFWVNLGLLFVDWVGFLGGLVLVDWIWVGLGFGVGVVFCCLGVWVFSGGVVVWV